MIRTAAVFCILTLTAAPAAAQTFGVPNTSNNAPSGAPVQIEDCKAGTSGNLLLSQSDGNFEVTFTNEGAVAADLIRFQIDFGQEQIFVRDAGTFSPGVTVKHRYRRRGGNVVSSPLLSPASLRCTVAAVHFVDGSDWTPSATTSPRMQASSASPNASAAIMGDGYMGVVFKQQADGVFASLVMPASPASRAGIRQGDRIATIESNTIATVNDAIQLISGTPPGTKVQISVIRNGQTVPLTVVVGKRPSQTPE